MPLCAIRRKTSRKGGHPAVSPRASATCFVVTAMLLLVGCASDDRISMDELTSLENEAAAAESVVVDVNSLSLAEVAPYKLGPGDVIMVRVIGLETDYSVLEFNARIHDDGSITAPLAGAVTLADLKLDEAELKLQAAYVPDYVKRASVYIELVEPRTTTVVVAGATMRPGPVTLRRNERNVLYALANSGGFESSASGRVRVQPIRTDREPSTYDLSKIDDLRRALLRPPLDSGDLVFVEPAMTSQVYLTGLVNLPGPVPIPQRSRISFIQALSAAGGLVDFLAPSEATLWRALDDGRRVRVKVDLEGVLAGKMPDFDLLPGDILDVPHTPETRFREWAAQNIRIGPFGVTAVYDPVSDYRARILRNDSGDDLFRRTLLSTLSTGVSEILVPPTPTP